MKQSEKAIIRVFNKSFLTVISKSDIVNFTFRAISSAGRAGHS